MILRTERNLVMMVASSLLLLLQVAAAAVFEAARVEAAVGKTDKSKDLKCILSISLREMNVL